VGLVVAKVGGSLFDQPDLGERLRRWVGQVDAPVLLVPGGGAGADVIRQLDQAHRIGEEAAHWLALRVLTVNAHFLAALLDAPVQFEPGKPPLPLAVLDPHAFCQADEGGPGALPHSWHVTSDSIAARVAERSGARLALLKSIELPSEITWEIAGHGGQVDEVFANVVARAGLRVKWVNLRSPDSLPR
jgi:aspartokinase-like uncharacterized kinase